MGREQTITSRPTLLKKMKFMHFVDHPKLIEFFFIAAATENHHCCKIEGMGNLFLPIQDLLCNSGILHDKQ